MTIGFQTLRLPTLAPSSATTYTTTWTRRCTYRLAMWVIRNWIWEQGHELGDGFV